MGDQEKKKMCKKKYCTRKDFMHIQTISGGYIEKEGYTSFARITNDLEAAYHNLETQRIFRSI